MSLIDLIIEVKKDEVKELRTTYIESDFQDSVFFNLERISLFNALISNLDIALIAEIKKASPSKGVIRDDFDHFDIAETYMNAGVDAISVLTDSNFFKGGISLLKDVAQIKTVPLLRKDFIIDEFQVLEAKANGADVVLLISEVLSKQQIKDLTQAAYENDMEVLLEIHSAGQIDKIDFDLNQMIGINNRNLQDFSVSIDNTLKLLDDIPYDALIVSESGLNGGESISRLLDTRVNGVLIGEHFMRADDIYSEVKNIQELCRRES